jgi:hypothetical protein
LFQFEVGAHLPDGLVIRPYEPRDADAILKLQNDKIAKWGLKDIEADLPDDLTLCFVLELAGEIIGTVSARPILDIGTVFDYSKMPPPAWRDAILRTWAKLVACALPWGYKEAFASVVSPTPGWVRFLEKRLGFRRITAPSLKFQMRPPE